MKNSTFKFWDGVITLIALGLAIACIWLMVQAINFADYVEKYYG